MQRKFTFFPAIALLALMQLAAITTINAQVGTQGDGFLLRITIDGVSTEYANGDCGYGYAAFGGEITEDICGGEVVWASDITPDSLACDTITEDLTGKIALIRRGVCNFSLKAFYAQEAGAEYVIIVNHFNNAADNGCTITNMAAGTNGDSVTIPAVSVGRDIGDKLDAAINAGKSIEVCFVLPRLYSPAAAYHYATPVTQVDTLNNIGVRYVNRDVVTQDDVVLKADIREPNGNVTTLTTTIDGVTAGLDTFVYFPSYLPPAILGRFDVEYSNSVYTESRDSVHRSFYHTPYTFATDNLTIDPLGVSWSATQVATYNFQEQYGSLYITGPDGGVATHGTFGIANAAAIAGTGADDITVILYDGDPDDDGVIDLVAGFTDLDNAAGGQVGFGTYTILGTEPVDTLISVEISDFTSGGPVILKPRHFYYLSTLYNGANGTTGLLVAFSNTTEEYYLNFPTTPVFLDQFYSGISGATIIERLQLEGYPANLVKVNPAILEASKVVITPNPANTQLRLDLNLSKVNDNVTVSLIDWTGRFVSTQVLKNFQNGQTTFDVSALPSGTYLVQVSAQEGNTMRKVSVCH